MYTVIIENFDRKNLNDYIENESFRTEKEAKKCKRSFIKKYNLINHGGYIVNYSDRFELRTSF